MLGPPAGLQVVFRGGVGTFSRMLCKAGGLRDRRKDSIVGHARIRTKYISPSLPVPQDALRAAHQWAEPLCIHRTAKTC